MNKSNKSHSDKVDVYSSINDLTVFKIANFQLNYKYKFRAINYKKKSAEENEYEKLIKTFFEREIINYSCRRSPVLSNTFWDDNGNESSKMMFRYENRLKNSKLRVLDNIPFQTAVDNLKKIEYFSLETHLEAEMLRQERDFILIHEYLIEAQKKIRQILESIIELAVISFEDHRLTTRTYIQKDLIIHLENLEKINLNKPELCLRIRKCQTRLDFPKKSDCHTPYFYSKRLEEDKYCSKRCKIDYPLFESANNKTKRVTRRERSPL